MQPSLAVWGAAISAVLSHNFSLILLLKGKLSGGKGMATAGGALLFYKWPLLILAVVLALSLFFSTGYILLGQLGAILFLPFTAYIFYPEDFPFIALLSFLIFLKHLPRIKLFLQGKEPKWYHKLNKQRKKPA